MYNYSGRFFAFGCSFTASHDRPTWADVVGRQFAEYQNWARGGMGNQFIFNQLVEANTRYKFTSDDTIMIMWTSVTREDRYVERSGGWIGHGNIYWQNLYNADFVRQFACERGYLLRDLATISAAQDLLSAWNVNYNMMSMIPFAVNELQQTGFGANITDIVNLYKPVLAKIKPSVYEIVFNSQDWNLKSTDFGKLSNGQRDPHPDPQEALEYVQKVLPDLTLSQDTIDWVNNFKFGDPAPQYYLVNRF